MYPVTQALQFLQEQTYLNTDNATGLEDPNITGTVLVKRLVNQYGEEVSAIVCLDDTGNEQHDFETVEV